MKMASRSKLLSRRPATVRRAAVSAGCALTLMCLAQAPVALGGTIAGDGGQTGQLGTGGNVPSASALLEQCATTGEQGERAATFSGEMTAMAGAARMGMRIDLQERLSGEIGFHLVTAPGLGVWRASSPGVMIYKYVKQVTDLSFPAVYRAVVRFHWLNVKGRVMRRTALLTPVCAQPAPPALSTPTSPGATSTPGVVSMPPTSRLAVG
ncbi:MAG TPA: hypothetical protein VGL68_04820 [Solirubrobacteraceae bacterium]|jgi:hypothetical protein